MQTTALDYSTTLLTATTPKQAFDAINNVRAWWTVMFEGASDKLGDVFTVRFGETYITMKVTELVPDKKVVWQVTDSFKHYLKNKQEWQDTSMTWEISGESNTTRISFAHHGLLPGMECYNGCENAWNFYLKESLYKLLTEGKGVPDLK